MTTEMGGLFIQSTGGYSFQVLTNRRYGCGTDNLVGFTRADQFTLFSTATPHRHGFTTRKGEMRGNFGIMRKELGQLTKKIKSQGKNQFF